MMSHPGTRIHMLFERLSHCSPARFVLLTRKLFELSKFVSKHPPASCDTRHVTVLADLVHAPCMVRKREGKVRRGLL